MRAPLTALLTASLALGCAVLSPAARATAPAIEPAATGMWVWEASATGTPESMVSLLAFADSRGVNQVYLQSERLLRTPDGRERLSRFLDAAAAREIAVHLLGGDPGWAGTEQAAALAFAHDASRFALDRRQSGKPTPAALHVDVEPHLLDGWRTDHEAVARRYLAVLDRIAKVARAAQLPLIVDVPSWYDERPGPSESGAATLLDAVLSRVDGIVVMAYDRDEARAVQRAKGEVEKAGSAGKKAIVAIETRCGNPASTTYCGSSMREVDSVLGRWRQSLRDRNGFGGVAVHAYRHWKALR